MLFTMNQFMAHLIGDYIFQTDYQGTTKKQNNLKGYIACFWHCAWYLFPFIILTKASLFALFLIFATHYIIDKTYLVAWLIWKKNNIFNGTNPNYGWEESKQFVGHNPTRLPHISHWLGIIADNILHLVLNAIFIFYC